MVKRRKGNLIVLGLSALNVERLMAGQPILFDAGTLGPEFGGFKLSIVYGRTEADIAADLDAKLGPPETTIKG